VLPRPAHQRVTRTVGRLDFTEERSQVEAQK
jgi:hypothetical protein